MQLLLMPKANLMLFKKPLPRRRKLLLLPKAIQ